MSDWQDEQRTNRRFLHKSQAKGRHFGHRHTTRFQPRHMLGKYAVWSDHFGTIERGGVLRTYLEIHELVASDTAYLASFDFATVKGVMLLAGSRKSLAAAVQEEDDDDDDDEEEEEENEDEDEDEEVISRQVTNDSDEEEGSGLRADHRPRGTHDQDEHDRVDDTLQQDTINTTSFISAASLAGASHAFEKNTFRTPKWFAQWRGQIGLGSQGVSTGRNAGDSVDGPVVGSTGERRTDGKAHFKFTSWECNHFEATFSCADLGMEDVTLKGSKVTSKATAPMHQWLDLSS